MGGVLPGADAPFLHLSGALVLRGRAHGGLNQAVVLGPDDVSDGAAAGQLLQHTVAPVPLRPESPRTRPGVGGEPAQVTLR